MFWNLLRKIDFLFLTYGRFWHMVDHNITINDQNSTKTLVLLQFCSRLDQNAFQKIKRKWKKNVTEKNGHFFFIKKISSKMLGPNLGGGVGGGLWGAMERRWGTMGIGGLRDFRTLRIFWDKKIVWPFLGIFWSIKKIFQFF